MPTENRSSNTEMVSVPRELLERCDFGKNTASALAALPELRAVLAQPAPQPHAEPIAWMVGTAIWRTKEEAERDAAATGLPIVGLGPMTGIAPAEQSKGTPVGEVVAFGKGLHEIAWAQGKLPRLGEKLYTHADPVEVERLRADLETVKADRDAYGHNAIDLRARLAEAQALLRTQDDLLSKAFQHDIGTPLKREIRAAALTTSAEPSAPTDIDRDALVAAVCVLRS